MSQEQLKASVSTRIQSLGEVTVQKSSHGSFDAFYVSGNELAHFIGDDKLRLHFNEACQEKIGGALRSEHRAVFEGPDDNWVTLSFSSDVDIEFLFLYIRYAWKYWRD